MQEIEWAGLERRGRELEILQLVAQGCSRAETARTLRLAEETVELHLSNVERRLGGSDPDESKLERCRDSTLLTLSVAHALVQDGWARGEFKRADRAGRTAYCLVGALDEAAEGLGLGLRESRRSAEAILAGLGKSCPGFLPRPRLSFWNDRRQRPEVLAALVKAMSLCAGEPGPSRSRHISRRSLRREPEQPLAA